MTLYIFWTVFRSSSGVQDCTYSKRHLSNRYCCLLASKHTAVSVSRQQYLFDNCLLLYVQSWTPDDGRKYRPKHVECHSKLNKFDTLVHLVGFTIGIRNILFSSYCYLKTVPKWQMKQHTTAVILARGPECHRVQECAHCHHFTGNAIWLAYPISSANLDVIPINKPASRSAYCLLLISLLVLASCLLIASFVVCGTCYHVTWNSSHHFTCISTYVLY